MNRVDLPKILFFAVCGMLLFVWGLAVASYKVFPYQLINFAHDSVLQVYADLDMMLGRRPTKRLSPARYPGNGVVKLSPGEVAPGLTFITGFFDGGNEMRLIRLDGTIVHRWPVSFSDIWPDPRHIGPESAVPKSDWRVDIHGALALPDGSAVFNFEYAGLVKISRCGTVEWTVANMVHHSVTRSEGGGFWVSGRYFVHEKSAFPGLSAPYLEDVALKVSAEGEVLAEISIPNLFYKNGMLAILVANGMKNIAVPEAEIVHLNDVEELPSALAPMFPGFAAGDLVISLRELNSIMVIDPKTETVKWYQTGPWLRQHDPDFLPNGKIMVFDNNTDNTESGSRFGGSRIVQIDPSSRETSVLYGGKPGEHFYTRIRGKQQALKNGNILISEARAGRVIEVTGDGDIVWEFINRYDESHIARITSAIRYGEDYFEVEDWSCTKGEAGP